MFKHYIILALAAVPLFLTAQHVKVNLDFESAYIGQNDPLPAETDLLFTGAIPAYIDRVEIRILSSRGKDGRDPLHVAVWQRPLDNRDATYSLPVNYRLRASSRYDIEAYYFNSLELAEREQLIERMQRRLMLYLDSHRSPGSYSLGWEERPLRLLRGMNALLDEFMAPYRAALHTAPEGFSSLLQIQMEKMANTNLPADSLGRAAGYAEANDLLNRLLREELEGIFPERLYQLADSRYLEDCPTSTKRGSISINVGYGGVHLSGDSQSDFDYGAAPYAGLSFPLGNSAFAPRFLSNTYIGLGVFVNNLENDAKQIFSGPVIGRPIYGSLDFKLFQFVYLNLGAALLEERRPASSNVILVRPFVGLSAKVNLSLSFDR
jgi:hypothetical protein